MIKNFKNICKAQNVSYFWTLTCWLHTLYLISKIFQNKLQSGSSAVHCPNSFEKGIALDCLQKAQLVDSPQVSSHRTILSFWALVTTPQSASHWLKTGRMLVLSISSKPRLPSRSLSLLHRAWGFFLLGAYQHGGSPFIPILVLHCLVPGVRMMSQEKSLSPFTIKALRKFLSFQFCPGTLPRDPSNTDKGLWMSSHATSSLLPLGLWSPPPPWKLVINSFSIARVVERVLSSSFLNILSNFNKAPPGTLHT